MRSSGSRVPARRALAYGAIALPWFAAAATAQPCAQWVPIAPVGVSPVARWGHRIEYDRARDRVVLYGGYDNANYLDDTWEYNPTTHEWVRMTPVMFPSSRAEFGLAYDTTRERIVLFSGANTVPMSGHHLPGLWEWDGATWAFANPTGPTGRHGHVTTFDSARGRMVLSFSKHGETDTWEFAPSTAGQPFGGTWSLRQNGFPSTRAYNAMANDPSRATTFAFGGYDASKGAPGFFVYNDTFAWDGAAWTQLSPAVSPSARYAVGGVYDSTRRRFTIVAGTTGGMYLNDTWAFDGSTWVSIAAPGLPRREHPGLAFDARRGRIVLFGGHVTPGGALGDSHELVFDPEFTEQPRSLAVSEGDPASFTALAVSQGAGPIAYQWRKDEVEISGATSPTLTIPIASPGDEGVYVCVVTGSCGVIFSLPATLTVLGPCPGDTNGDRVVDFADLNTVLSQFGQTGPPGTLAGDVNDDGFVSFTDLNIVLGAFGASCPAA